MSCQIMKLPQKALLFYTASRLFFLHTSYIIVLLRITVLLYYFTELASRQRKGTLSKVKDCSCAQVAFQFAISLYSKFLSLVCGCVYLPSTTTQTLHMHPPQFSTISTYSSSVSIHSICLMLATLVTVSLNQFALCCQFAKCSSRISINSPHISLSTTLQ